jgi:hypothetical protein
LKNLFQISLVVFIITFLVCTFWANLIQGTHTSWTGSLAYLPHGCKVIFFCFFGYRALPGLLLAEATCHFMEFHNNVLAFFYLASFTSLISVVVAAEILKWSKISIKSNINFYTKLNLVNYKFILLVIVLSALLSSVFTNVTLAAFNDVPINVPVIVRFFIGDIIGALLFLFVLMLIFRMVLIQKYFEIIK